MIFGNIVLKMELHFIQHLEMTHDNQSGLIKVIIQSSDNLQNIYDEEK